MINLMQISRAGIGLAGKNADVLAHSIGARHNAYADYLNSETYEDPITHQARTYQDGDLTGPYYPQSKNLKYTGAYFNSPEKALIDASTILFVNGIATPLATHIKDAQTTANKENHAVVGVFNATAITKTTKLASAVLGKNMGGVFGYLPGFAADVRQSISDDEGDMLNNPATATLVNALKQSPKRNIVAHSQGTLIVNAAFRHLKDKDEKIDLSGYNVKFFGSPASTQIVGPTYTDSSNNDDLVASFAMDGLSLVRNTVRLKEMLPALLGIHTSAFGDNERSRYNHRIFMQDQGTLTGPHNYENYENASPTFDQISEDKSDHGKICRITETPELESTAWPATLKAIFGYNFLEPLVVRNAKKMSRSVLSRVLNVRKSLISKAHATIGLIQKKAHSVGHWLSEKSNASRIWMKSKGMSAGQWTKEKSHSVEHWLGHKAHDSAHWIGDKSHEAGQLIDGKVHGFGQGMLQNRAQIGNKLHLASSILGGASAGLGIVAGGLALTGVGLPVAAVLGTLSLTLAAASAAAEAWYAVTKSVGTLDGSVTTGEANHAAAQAAKNLALTFVSVELSAARTVAKAQTMLETKNALSFLHSDPRTVLQLDKATKFLNKLPGINLGLVFRDAGLAKRLKIGGFALKAAKGLDTLAHHGGLRGMLQKVHHVQTQAAQIFRKGNAGLPLIAHFLWTGAKTAGLGMLHRGEQRAHQAGEFFHNLKEKYYPSPKHDGDFTGPFFPRGRSPWAGPPPPQSYLRSLVGTGKATLFVNGVNTTYEDHLKTAQRIAEDTGNALVGVFNASGVPSSPKGAAPSKIGMALGLLRDAGQTLSDKLFDRVNRNPAVKAVADLIVQYGDVDKGKGGLRIEAHSQGSVIVSEALRQARNRGADIGSKERGKQVHVNTWGNASWTFPLGPEYHHRVHDSDVIATGLGSSSRFANFVQTNPLAHWIAERFLGPMANAPADTRVLPHAGTGMEPHFVNQALPAGASGPKPHDYLDDRAKFEKLEQRRQPFSFRTNEQATTRALLPNVTPRNRELVRHGVVAAGRMALPGAATLLGGSLLGKGMALAEGAAMAAPPLARRVSAFGGNTVAPAYGRFDAGVRALPSLPFLPPNTVWGGADTLLRSAGSRVMGFADWLGGGKDRHGPGPALQRSGHGDHPDVNPAALRADLRRQSSGFLPDGNIRARLGGHLGFDPGGARLHTGPAAAAASRRLNAEAFTIGNDVFFGEGRFDPHTPKGLGLIAHELTHVGQQTGTTGSKARFFSEAGGDQMEREAQHTAEHVLANAGSRNGLFVEDYVREYEGESGLTQADQQRLDRISVMALAEAQRMLASQGMHGSVNTDALDVQVEIDLGEMSDGEAALAWAEAILSVTSISSLGATQQPVGIQRATPPKARGTGSVPSPAAAPPQAVTQMRQFVLDGNTKTVTEEEYQQLVAEAVRRLGIRLNLVESGAKDGLDVQRDFMKDHNFWGGVSDFLGKTSPPPEAIWSYPKPAISAGRRMFQPPRLEAASRELIVANQALNDSRTEWHRYLEATISGADTGIQVMTVVRDTSFSIAIGTAAVIAAPIVAGAIAATGAGVATTAVGTTLGVTLGGGAMGAGLRGGSEVLGEASANKGHVDWQNVGHEAWDGAKHGSVDAATSVIGMGAGRVVAKFIRPGEIGTGVRIVRGVISNGASGGIGGFLNAAVNPPPGTGKETRSQWAKRVGLQTVLGAGGGVVSGAGNELLAGAAPGAARRMMAAGVSNAVSGGGTSAIQEAVDAHQQGRKFDRSAVYKGALTSGISSSLQAGPSHVTKNTTLEQHNQRFDHAFEVAGSGRKAMEPHQVKLLATNEHVDPETLAAKEVSSEAPPSRSEEIDERRTKGGGNSRQRRQSRRMLMNNGRAKIKTSGTTRPKGAGNPSASFKARQKQSSRRNPDYKPKVNTSQGEWQPEYTDVNGRVVNEEQSANEIGVLLKGGTYEPVTAEGVGPGNSPGIEAVLVNDAGDKTPISIKDMRGKGKITGATDADILHGAKHEIEKNAKQIRERTVRNTDIEDKAKGNKPKPPVTYNGKNARRGSVVDLNGTTVLYIKIDQIRASVVRDYVTTGDGVSLKDYIGEEYSKIIFRCDNGLVRVDKTGVYLDRI